MRSNMNIEKANMSNNDYMCHSRSKLHLTSLTWNIENFSKCSCNDICSSSFEDEKENKFYLRLYSISNKVYNLTINLGTNDKSVNIRYKLSLIACRGVKSLLHENSGTVSCTSTKSSYNSYGYSSTPSFDKTPITISPFITEADLLEPTNGYLTGDTLSIHCEFERVDMISQISKNEISPKEAELENAIKTLEDYGKLLKSGQFADVTLVAEGKFFPVHKSILSARSPVFAAMFSHETKDKTETQIEIRDVKGDAFEAFLEFLYSSAMPNLEVTSAKELLVIADRYGSEQLKSVCEDYLISRLNIETAPNINLLATSVNSTKLKERTFEFMRSRTKELFEVVMKEPDQLTNMFQFLAQQNGQKEDEAREIRKGEKRKLEEKEGESSKSVGNEAI